MHLDDSNRLLQIDDHFQTVRESARFLILPFAIQRLAPIHIMGLDGRLRATGEAVNSISGQDFFDVFSGVFDSSLPTLLFVDGLLR